MENNLDKEDKKFLSSKEFTDFVLAVIRQKAAAHEQIILTGTDAADNIRYHYKDITFDRYTLFDAVAPMGFELNSLPVFFEFKFYPNKKLRLSDVLKFFSKHQKTDATFILIIYGTFEQAYEFQDNEACPPNIIIWDRTVVESWIAEYPVDYYNVVSLRSKNGKKHISDVADRDFYEKSDGNILVVKNLIKRNVNFALVLGAGVSCDLGAKDWFGLLQQLKDNLRRKGLIADPNSVCKRIGDTLLITAEICKDLYHSERDFYWEIHKGLYHSLRMPMRPTVIDAITSLISRCQNGRNFRVLTYNYDDFLEKALDSVGIQYSILFDQVCALSENVPIYHAHDYFPEVKSKQDMQDGHCQSIVLTESNYNGLYNHPYSWTISCQLSFFRENTCLFVGSSLSDPNIRRLLQITKTEDKVHYAIMVKKKMGTKDLTIMSNHFRKLGVEIIWVDDYPDVVSTLKKL